ncbi:MAG: zf-HC2 domain-containing protein [Sphaerochaetaceae bacterium]|nr:zf-HC2 domain-containing protein [Sphaerochaetaceae bacterium]
MCLDDQILNTYLDGELSEPWKTQVEEHLSYCVACKERLNRLKNLKKMVCSAQLTDDEIAPRQEKVLSFMEKNYFNKKKPSLIHKKIKVSFGGMLGVAAAFTLIFATVIWGGQGDSQEFIPNTGINTDINENNVSMVSVREPQIQTLDDYTLEEILTNLDDRGYTVDLHIKGVQPVEFDSTEDLSEDEADLSEPSSGN